MSIKYSIYKDKFVYKLLSNCILWNQEQFLQNFYSKTNYALNSYMKNGILNLIPNLL